MAPAVAPPIAPAAEPSVVPAAERRWREPRWPAGWDPETDLLVLAGRESPAHALELEQRGHRRVIAYAPGPREPAAGEHGTGKPGADSPRAGEPGAGSAGAGSSALESLARTHAELLDAVLALRGKAPARLAVHPSSPDADAALLKSLASAAAEALSIRRLHRNTAERHGPVWLAQGLANLDLLARHPSIAVLQGAFAGVPAVLVSPGPSLSRNVAQLRELHERALIISGTHALSALAAAGVAPHLVVATDAGDLVRHLEGIDLAPVEALVAGIVCRRELFELPFRRTFTFAGNGEADAWIQGPRASRSRLPTGGSVACSQFSLALALGCDPIALVGQDLALDGDSFYADGCVDGTARAERDAQGRALLVKPAGSSGLGLPLPDGRLLFTTAQDLCRVPGGQGGEVETTTSLRLFLRWFEAQAQAFAPSHRLWNCTEGGAHIAGMEHLLLAEAAARFGAAEWTELGAANVAAILDRAAEREPADRRSAEVREHVARTLGLLDPVLALARSADRLAERALRDRRALDELARVEGELSSALRGVRVLALAAQREIEAARDDAARARSLPENVAASRRLYAVALRAVAAVREPLERVRARL